MSDRQFGRGGKSDYPSIIDMLNAIRGKAVRIETINERPQDNVEEGLKRQYGLKNIAHDGNGTYIIEANSAEHKISEGINVTYERDELINLANVSRIVFGVRRLPPKE